MESQWLPACLHKLNRHIFNGHAICYVLHERSWKRSESYRIRCLAMHWWYKCLQPQLCLDFYVQLSSEERTRNLTV